MSLPLSSSLRHAGQNYYSGENALGELSNLTAPSVAVIFSDARLYMRSYDCKPTERRIAIFLSVSNDFKCP